jgi:hypothetical protein
MPEVWLLSLTVFRALLEATARRPRAAADGCALSCAVST